MANGLRAHPHRLPWNTLALDDAPQCRQRN
jgi:hypothetical protein